MLEVNSVLSTRLNCFGQSEYTDDEAASVKQRYLATETKGQDVPAAFNMKSTRPFQLIPNMPETVVDSVLAHFDVDRSGDWVDKALRVSDLSNRDWSDADWAAYRQLTLAPAGHMFSCYQPSFSCTWTDRECSKAVSSLGLSCATVGEVWMQLLARTRQGHPPELADDEPERATCKRWTTLGETRVFMGFKLEGVTLLAAHSSNVRVTLRVWLCS